MKNKDIKKIIYKLLQEEIKEHGLEVEILPLTNIENICQIIKYSLAEYSTNKTSLKNLLLEIKTEIQTCQLATGCCSKTKNSIKILLENFKKNVSTPEQYLWALIHTTYHEYKHIIIYHNEFETQTGLSYFYLLIEHLVKNLSDYYLEAHNNFYEEIMADKYATEKTIKYLKKHKPTIYKKLKTYIKTFSLEEEIRYQNYDIQQFVNYINNIIKGKVDKSTIFTNEFPWDFLSTIYYEDGTFKNIQAIFTNTYWDNFPKEAKYLIVSSEAYLEDIDYKNTSIEELVFILDAIEYILNIEKKRNQTNEELKMKITNLINKLPETNIYYLRNKLVLLPRLVRHENNNSRKIKYLEEKHSQILEYLIIKTNTKKKQYINQ